jgi:hypothetical protein
MGRVERDGRCLRTLLGDVLGFGSRDLVPRS